MLITSLGNQRHFPLGVASKERVRDLFTCFSSFVTLKKSLNSSYISEGYTEVKVMEGEISDKANNFLESSWCHFLNLF